MLLALTEAIRRKVAAAIKWTGCSTWDRFRGGYGGAGLTSGLDGPESFFQA